MKVLQTLLVCPSNVSLESNYSLTSFSSLPSNFTTSSLQQLFSLISSTLKLSFYSSKLDDVWANMTHQRVPLRASLRPSWVFADIHITVSSAHIWQLTFLQLSDKSFMYELKGPKIEPCGTAVLQVWSDEWAEHILTLLSVFKIWSKPSYFIIWQVKCLQFIWEFHDWQYQRLFFFKSKNIAPTTSLSDRFIISVR